MGRGRVRVAGTAPLATTPALIGRPTDQLPVVAAGLVDVGEMVDAHVTIMTGSRARHIGRNA